MAVVMVDGDALCFQDDYFTGCIDQVVVNNEQLSLLLPDNATVGTCGPRSAHTCQLSANAVTVSVCVCFSDRLLILRGLLRMELGSWVEDI